MGVYDLCGPRQGISFVSLFDSVCQCVCVCVCVYVYVCMCVEKEQHQAQREDVLLTLYVEELLGDLQVSLVEAVVVGDVDRKSVV